MNWLRCLIFVTILSWAVVGAIGWLMLKLCQALFGVFS